MHSIVADGTYDFLKIRSRNVCVNSLTKRLQLITKYRNCHDVRILVVAMFFAKELCLSQPLVKKLKSMRE